MTKQLSYSLAISRHSNLTADKVFNLFYKWLPDVYIFPPWKKSDILFEGIALFTYLAEKLIHRGQLE